jgi:hypothetical protein
VNLAYPGGVGDGAAIISLFFVVAAFVALVFFFAVAVELDVVLVVVIISFLLLAHDVNRPTAMRAATEQANTGFID